MYVKIRGIWSWVTGDHAPASEARTQLTQSAHPSGDRRVISSVVIKTVQRVGNFSLWQISVLQPYCILYPCYWPYLDYDCSSTYSLYLCYIRSFPPSQDININMMPFVTEDGYSPPPEYRHNRKPDLQMSLSRRIWHWEIWCEARNRESRLIDNSWEPY